jgi:hypothetical protein
VAGLLGGLQEDHHRTPRCADGGAPPPGQSHPGPGQGGATGAFARGPGRPRKDLEVTELEAEVERTSRALKELAIENTVLREK